MTGLGLRIYPVYQIVSIVSVQLYFAVYLYKCTFDTLYKALKTIINTPDSDKRDEKAHNKTQRICGNVLMLRISVRCVKSALRLLALI